MNRILDSITVKQTGNRYRNEFDMDLRIETKETTPPMEAYKDPFVDEYCMKLELGTWFRCNNAELPRATENAQRQMVAKLYEGVLTDLYKCRSQVMGGDREGVIQTLCELINDIEGSGR